MKSWSYVQILISVLLCFQSRAECSSVDIFNMKISNTSRTITLMWETPDKTKSEMCYKSEVQHKAHCDRQWKHIGDISGLYFKLPAPDMKKNYIFRLRMRLECLGMNWTEWSPEKRWRNETDVCIVETSLISIRDYLLVTLLPLASVLLLYAVTQKRFRRFILPIIPDPKNTQEKILNMEEFQWIDSLAQPCEECSTAEIEVVHESDEEPNKSTHCGLDEPPLHIQPTHTPPTNHDLYPTPKASMYFTYSPDTPEDNTFLQNSHTMPGYIVI